ncbi:MAG TPA: FG-GAP-like repeat-containing protein [Verrucomicrobiae bacterium]|nr:FG-GAP-like repeat-containing protein [Verrucomicrobiae bacterium]
MKKLLAIFAVAAVAAISIYAQTSDPAPPGLVAWWRGEGNANDSIGTNNGTLSPSGAAYAAGKVGEGFLFNGTNGYVQIPDSPALNQTNEFTIELWYEDTGSTGYAGLVSKRPLTVGPCNFEVQIQAGNPGAINAVFEEASSGSFQISSYSPAPTTGVFHHLAVTYKQLPLAQVEVKTFIDGQLKKTATLPGSLTNTVNNVPVTVGCSNPVGGEFFKGVIDEVSYYNRALSTNEIAAIYNAGSAGKSIDSSVPVITAVSPSSGNMGDMVSITGTNFSPVAASNTVYFGAVRAVVNAASTTNLTVTVPKGATYSPITETVDGLTAYSGPAFSPTFMGGAGITNNSFGPLVTLDAPAGQNGVTVADIDGDGKPDLVTANYHDGTVSVYRNTTTNGIVGASSFASPVTIAVGNETADVAVGDLTGDGRLDLVAVNQTSGTVSVLQNTSTPGMISFAQQFDLATPTDCRSVLVRDMDGDGKPDIVVASLGSAVVSIYRNISEAGSLATNSFASRVDFATPNTALTVSAADLNGDGKPDLVTGNGNSVSIFRNTSTPGIIDASSFAPRLDLGTNGVSVWGVAIGDVDGDGRPDLLAANPIDNTMTVLRNTTTATTNITFATKVVFGAGNYPYWVALGDLNGDGKPDVVVSAPGDYAVSVFQNKSIPGSFDTNSLGAYVSFGTGGGSREVRLADVNGDGRLDIVACNLEGGPYVSILPNALPFGGPPVITDFSPQSGEVSTTVNVIGHNFDPTPSNNVVYFGAVQAVVNAASTTSLTVTVPKGATYAPITETVGGLTAYSSTPFLPTFPDGGVLSESSLAARLDLATPSSPDIVAVGDLDGDGKPDLVVHCGVNMISIFQNISTNGSITAGSFGPRIDLPIGGASATAGGLALADVNGDGRLDIVTSSYVDRKISIFQNFCTPGVITSNSFGTRVDVPVNGGPVTLAVQDLDGDGWLDIVTGNLYANTVSVLRNLGASGGVATNSFAPQVDFSVPVNSRWVTIADLDGDGKPDVATVDYNDGSGVMSVLRNTATPGNISSNSFAPRLDFAGLPDGSDVKTCDLDGDGKLDVVVAAGANGRAVSVYRNTSTPGNVAFASRVDFGLGGWGNGVALGDLDGDGKPDVAVAARSSDNLSLFRNVSDPGSFTSGSLAARLDFSSGSNPFGPAIGDLNGDGRPDVVFANNFSGTISIYQNIVHPQIHFVWSPIPSPRFVNTPFNVVIQAQDSANEPATNFTGTVTLQSTNSIPVLPATSGNFVQGVWTGSLAVPQTATNLVLQATDNVGESGLASPINVVNLPALAVLSSSGTLLLAWPASPSGFEVETSPSLSPANWTSVTNQQPFQYGGQNLLFLPTTGTNAFYRLHLKGP